MSVRQVPRKKKGCRAKNKARRPQRQLMSLSLRKTHIMNLCVLELTNIHGFKQSILLNIFLAKECSPSNLWLSLTTDIKTLISTRSWARPRLHLLRLCHWWMEKREPRALCFDPYFLLLFPDLGVISQAQWFFPLKNALSLLPTFNFSASVLLTSVNCVHTYAHTYPWSPCYNVHIHNSHS